MSDDKQTPDQSKGSEKIKASKSKALQADKTTDTNQSGSSAKQEKANTHANRPKEKPQKLFESKPIPKMKAPKKQRNIKLLPIIASILVILALITIGWSIYNQHQIEQDWQQLQSNINEQLQSQQQANQKTTQVANNSFQFSKDSQTTINQQTQLLQQLRQSLTATQEKIRELSGRQQQDWLLAEVEYLIKLAEYKITLEKDKLTAIGLLKTADEKVSEIGDNSLIELRQALAQDIANLQLVIAPDISGIFAQINAITQQIPSLNIIALEFAPIETRLKQADKPQESSTWEQIYQKFLDDFVTITPHDQPVKPLMSLEQRGNLNANIQLALQQAQIALLRGEQTVYQTSLNNAETLIEEYFKADELTKQLTQQLSELKQNQINIDLPKQISAKKTIQSINQTRLYQWLQQPEKQAVDDIPVESQP
ncbi:uroporphyrinogen-III C-methyltransferase [Aliikangiella sp. IMCC44359]|uniref:uroporphyrinogen-III C-methyltransferase n=1 Tax=Aliikangiella sp. IMCC44359 TaxID=3459125 RepID=UPI00403B1790